MLYEISRVRSGILNEKRIYPGKASTYEEAELLLKEFRNRESQCGNKVSEIQNNKFHSLNVLRQKENIFQIEDIKSQG